MASIKWDKYIDYRKYTEQTDGSFMLSGAKKVGIKAFQPISESPQTADDGTIAFEFMCIAQLKDDIEIGTKLYIDQKQYVVSGVQLYKFEGASLNNLQLTLRYSDVWQQ